MVKMIPPSLSPKVNFTERTIFEGLDRVANRLDWIAIHGLYQRKVVRGFEAEGDFIVLVPNKGIVIIEVKGATKATLDEEKGTWELEGVPEGTEHKSPMDQVDGTRRNIRAQLRSLDFDVDSIPMARLVWFPLIDPKGFARLGKRGMNFQDWEFAFKNDDYRMVEVIENVLDSHNAFFEKNDATKFDPETLTVEEIVRIKEALIVQVSGETTIEGAAEIRNREVEKATDQQLAIMDALLTNQNVFIQGPAGTGKSKSLAHAATALAEQGRKVLLTCYNLMMADYYQVLFNDNPNIDVYGINDLFLETARLKTHKSGNTWYDTELPTKASNALKINQNLGIYDAICIDEFQDIASKPLVLDAIFRYFDLESEFDPVVVLASDDFQQIMREGGSVDSLEVAREFFGEFTHINLTRNCRQVPGLSHAIYEVLGRDDRAIKHLVPKDIEWSFTVVRPKPGKETTALSEVLDSLLLKHRPEDIRILSPFGENHSLLARLFHRDSEGVVERELKKKFRHASTSGQIRWRSISKFKGLEEDVVIITDISNAAIAWLKDKPLKMTDLLYVGMTRAKFHVVLLISDNLYPSAKSKQ
jgi:hypothetical protein